MTALAVVAGVSVTIGNQIPVSQETGYNRCAVRNKNPLLHPGYQQSHRFQVPRLPDNVPGWGPLATSSRAGHREFSQEDLLGKTKEVYNSYNF
jgi:hypothetical protein